MQPFQPAHTTTLLVKLAVHSARSIEIHHDGGQSGLFPFEIEMRRRLWWYILALDAQACETEGHPDLATIPRADTALPLNIDDIVSPLMVERISLASPNANIVRPGAHAKHATNASIKDRCLRNAVLLPTVCDNESSDPAKGVDPPASRRQR